jgi:hypothetical protein
MAEPEKKLTPKVETGEKSPAQELKAKLQEDREKIFGVYNEDVENKEAARTFKMRESIKTMSMEEVNKVLQDPEWQISDHNYEVTLQVRNEMLKMDPSGQLERFKKLTELGRRDYDKTCVRFAAENRKQELFEQEWSNWGSEEEMPIEVVEAPVKKAERKVA